MSNLFHQIQDAHVILTSKGIWRQAPVFTYGDGLFAKWGSGFIGLRMNLSSKVTTLPTVNWDHLEGVEFTTDQLGRMIHKRKGVRAVA